LASDVHANMYQFAAKAYEVADAMLEARKWKHGLLLGVG
jgi:hypothetical protein